MQTSRGNLASQIHDFPHSSQSRFLILITLLNDLLIQKVGPEVTLCHSSSNFYKGCPNLLFATLVSIEDVEINIRSIFYNVMSTKLHEQEDM